MTHFFFFAADGYHIQLGSAAIRQGVPSALAQDIDRQGRSYTSILGVGGYWLTENWLPVVRKD